MSKFLPISLAAVGAEALTGLQSAHSLSQSMMNAPVSEAIGQLLEAFKTELTDNEHQTNSLVEGRDKQICEFDAEIEETTLLIETATKSLEEAEATRTAQKGIIKEVSSGIEKKKRQIADEQQNLENYESEWQTTREDFEKNADESVAQLMPTFLQALEALSAYSGAGASVRAQRIEDPESDAMQAESGDDLLAEFQSALADLDTAQKAAQAKAMPETTPSAAGGGDAAATPAAAGLLSMYAGSSSKQQSLDKKTDALIMKYAPIVQQFRKAKKLHEKVVVLLQHGAGSYDGEGAKKAFGMVEAMFTKAGQDFGIDMENFIVKTDALRELCQKTRHTITEFEGIKFDLENQRGDASDELGKANNQKAAAESDLGLTPDSEQTTAQFLEAVKANKATFAENEKLRESALKQENLALVAIIDVVKEYQKGTYHADNAAPAFIQTSMQSENGICDQMAMEVIRSFVGIYDEMVNDFQEQNLVFAKKDELHEAENSLLESKATIDQREETATAELGTAQLTMDAAAERKQSTQKSLAEAVNHHKETNTQFDKDMEDAETLSAGLKEIRAIWADQMKNVAATAEEHRTDAATVHGQEGKFSGAMQIVDDFAQQLGHKIATETITMAREQASIAKSRRDLNGMIQHATHTGAVASQAKAGLEGDLKDIAAERKTANSRHQKLVEDIGAHDNNVQYWIEQAPQRQGERSASLVTNEDAIRSLAEMPMCTEEGANPVLMAVAQHQEGGHMCPSCFDLSTNGASGASEPQLIKDVPSAGMRYLYCNACVKFGAEFTVQQLHELCTSGEDAILSNTQQCKSLPPVPVAGESAVVEQLTAEEEAINEEYGVVGA